MWILKVKWESKVKSRKLKELIKGIISVSVTELTVGYV